MRGASWGRVGRLALVALVVVLCATTTAGASQSGATHHAIVHVKHKHKKKKHHKKPKPKPKPHKPSTSNPPTGASGSDGSSGSSDSHAGPFPAANAPASLSVSCPNADLQPNSSNLDLIKAAVLCLINQQRAMNGVGALTTNSLLEQAAQHHTDDEINNNYFGHTSPTGETSDSRVIATGYGGPGQHYEIGENLAFGTFDPTDPNPADDGSTPNAIVASWMASATHRANILKADFEETGFGIEASVPGVVSGGQPGATYTEEFGVRGG
jgi:uncharacterized protein YkwD